MKCIPRTLQLLALALLLGLVEHRSLSPLTRAVSDGPCSRQPCKPQSVVPGDMVETSLPKNVPARGIRSH